MNLVVNARESMPQGGTLTIRTNLEVMAPTGLSRDFGGRDGSFACLTVRDTGGGIAPDNLSPTFEPFFTDKGAGMGLATAYRIVKEHNGWIELESQLQAGSTYRVYLPLAPPAAGPHNGATGKKAHRGTETILLVEDEKSLRELMVLVLKDHGYTVLEAASGAAAQKVWAEHGSDIDLLLTDMVTPGGVTGLELAKRLRKQVPDLKVILTSGYSSHLTGIDPASAQNLALLKKPFSSLTLAEAVRDCLHGS
jgi:CheY-like chemotaxis protein